MTKTNVLTVGGGRNHIADLHFLHCDYHTINEQLDQLPFLLKRGLRETTTHTLTKLSDGTRKARQFDLLMHTCFDLTSLVVQSLQSLLQVLASSLVLSQRQHISHIGFCEPLQLSTQARARITNLGSSCLQFLRKPLATLRSLQCLLNDPWLEEHLTNVLPHEFVQLIGWNMAAVTGLIAP